MMRVGSGARRGVIALAAASAVAMMLAGCVATASTPTATPSRSATPVPSSTATAAPTIQLTGTAHQNLPYFDMVNQQLIAKGGTLDGRAFIDNLVAAGYPKSAMEVTPDRTSINLQADNIEFSVRINGTCLVGEYGNIGYASTAQKIFSTGRCLAGTTRPIDW